MASQTAGDAVAGNILSGKKAWVNGSQITGSMTDRGAVSQSLAANGTYTIPAGYHNGQGKVTQSLTGKAAATYTPSTSNQTIAANQWLTGAQTIKGDANLVAGNIKKGTSIFGVSGAYDPTASYNPGMYTYPVTSNITNGMTYTYDGPISAIIVGEIRSGVIIQGWMWSYGIYMTKSNISGYTPSCTSNSFTATASSGYSITWTVDSSYKTVTITLSNTTAVLIHFSIVHL